AAAHSPFVFHFAASPKKNISLFSVTTASRASLPVAHVDSVAQFVRRRKLRAGRNGRRVAASPAARSGRGARPGRAARSVATRVRGGGYVAERREHHLYADNAGCCAG